MIPFLVGWQQTRGKGWLSLVPPEGPGLGAIRYDERMRPLDRIGVLVAEALAVGHPLADPVIGAAETLVTVEGEHGALVTVRGMVGGAPVQRDIGFVFGDDAYARVHSMCLRPADFARFTSLTRELVVRDTHAWGVRRRRFVYAAPDGWQPFVDGLRTEWVPPDYPGDGAAITVYPASPGAAFPAEVFESLLAEDLAAGMNVRRHKGPERMPLSHGLEGLVWELEHGAGYKCVAVLSDGRFSYCVTLDSTSPSRREVHGRAFEALVRSVQPIPAAGSAPRAQTALIDHWAE